MENQTSDETQNEETTEPTESSEEVETQEEPVEETSEETVETETPKTQAVDYENKFKESQAEALKLKKQVDELKKPKNTKPSDASKSEPLDVDSILEVQNATKGLDSDEVEELRLRAKAEDISLTEARKNENFTLWQDARKAKVAKEKSLKPSSTQSESSKPKTPEERLSAAKTFEEKEKVLDELGMNPMRLGTDLNKVEDFM